MGNIDSIPVAGELTLLRTSDVPPVPIRLPLKARTDRGALLRLGAFTGLGGAACVLAAAAMALAASEGMGHGTGVVPLLIPLGALVTGLCFLGTAATCAREAHESSPRIEIERDRMRDGRAGVTVPWISVTSVRPLCGRLDIAAVRLTLKAPIAPRRNPFRPGSPSLFTRRKPNELHVPVVALDVAPRLLAEVIVGLVREHGGTVQPRRPLL